MSRQYEIRDPVHGFIALNEWEWEIINHPVFQRLRRIRQLGLTDMVYPGAVHTRFEHSLGVMHVATRMFDSLVARERDFLTSEDMGFHDEGLKRERAIVRLAALLHDCGHAPFSHVAEDLMPVNGRTNRRYKHEDFSAAIIRVTLKDVIENHRHNDRNYRIKADEVAQLIDGDKALSLGRRGLWKSLISSQLDADRADYLLRDSHHAGVAYGRYDLDRVIVTLRLGISPEPETPVVVLDKSGIHAAEALILARYMMFTQVYFQKTRRIYDLHLQEAMRVVFGERAFPSPESEKELQDYLDWDDWKVAGLIRAGKGGDAGDKILSRCHDRMVFETAENPSVDEMEHYEDRRQRLEREIPETRDDCAETQWYKVEAGIGILENESKGKSFVDLSNMSGVVKGLLGCNQHRLYVPHERRETAREILGNVKQMAKETA